MRAVVITTPGDADVLQIQDVDEPLVNDDEVLIKISATALNKTDTFQRRGAYPPPKGASPYLGVECSGIIEALGKNVQTWKVGDEVCALLGGGGYAEKVAVPSGHVLPVPKGISLQEAATIPEVACTVWSTVFMTSHLSKGENFLVHGGSSGIGTFAIQIAKYYGARVFVTAGSEEKLARCKELGADVAINYKTEDFVARVKEETGGKGVDVILDNMGGSYLKRNLDALCLDGRLFLIGFQGGIVTEINLSTIFAKRLTIQAAGLREIVQAEGLCKSRIVHQMPNVSPQVGKKEYDKSSFDENREEKVIIVGAGPSGLAVAACLADLGISSLVLERDSCVGSLWKNRTYDRVTMQGGKELSNLPLMPVPDEFPMYLTRDNFVAYMEKYARRFNIQPQFCQSVESASFSQETGRWHVITKCSSDNSEREYHGRFLVVATGEFSEKFMPDIPGLDSFRGTVIHSIDYKNEKAFEGKRVLVVGCGNSGMEIALELVNNDAGPRPSMVVRSPNHILPREFFGIHTMPIALQLYKLLPLRVVDNLLLLCSNLALGNTASYGLPRPVEGPLEFKLKTGKTLVIDDGTVEKIRQHKIKVVPNFIRVTATGVVFEDGVEEDFDALIFATGYKNEVRRWLKNGKELFPEHGRPGNRPPSDWKGSDGLYIAGFGKKGLLGTSEDARRISQDIFQSLKNAS